MVREKGILWRMNEFIILQRSINLEKEFCIKGYLLYSIIKGLLKKIASGEWFTKEKNFKIVWYRIVFILTLKSQIIHLKALKQA